MPLPTHEHTRRMTSSDTMSFDERTLCEDVSEDESFDSRPSLDAPDSDHDLLASEDEREQLLTRKEGFTGLFNKKSIRIGKRDHNTPVKAKSKERKRRSNEETSALMYEMEEGVGMSNSSLSLRPSEPNERRLQKAAQRKARQKRIWRHAMIYMAFVVLFAGLLFGAYRASISDYSKVPVIMVSNGTSLFAPTTILISLDGFRADFLYRGLTPTLNKFIAEGVSPKYMLPSFPSVTFPNHFTLVTGLYPEAHGVVGNTFWDPELKKEFYYTDPERSLQSYWWGGEPIWHTAESQDVRVAVHMWPGSEAHVKEYAPAYVDKYNGSEQLARKVDRIMGLLDTPGPMDVGFRSNQPRPQLVAAYVPNVDSDGHNYGPNSTQTRETISNVDTMMSGILKGLQERNLTDIVNVVVVSDHGMATTDTSRLIQLEDLVDPAELEHIDGWPSFGLRPKKNSELERLHKQIIDRAQNMTGVEVYRRDTDMPERYHFSRNERIAPLWIIPRAGWAILSKADGNVEEMKQKGDVYHPRGVHGYDHEHPLMRAIFVARGPAFPHKPNSRVEPFQNIELYNIICDSIGITPAPNNGTLRLPLKPVGLHTDLETPPNETPADPVDTTSSPALPSTAADATLASATPIPLATSLHPNVVASPTSSASPAETSSAGSWWEWLTHQAENAEDWVDNFLHDHFTGLQDGDKGKGGGNSKKEEDHSI